MQNHTGNSPHDAQMERRRPRRRTREARKIPDTIRKNEWRHGVPSGGGDAAAPAQAGFAKPMKDARR
jgi:hypothetical protein